VALPDELVDVAPGEGAFEEEHHVVDHVLVRDVVEERGQRLHRVGAQVLELAHQLEGGLLLQRRRRHVRLVRQERVVVRLLQVQLDVLERLALRQVVVVPVRQDSSAHAAQEGLA
jgi:hypothetical protein